MASKAKSRTAAPLAKAPETASRRERLNDRHANKAVERFKTASKGFRGVFGGHFPGRMEEVESLAFHLAQVEAHMPTTVEAIRLARYPGAGKRDPRRMALGLCENLSVLRSDLARAIAALEKIADCGKSRAKKTKKKR